MNIPNQHRLPVKAIIRQAMWSPIALRKQFLKVLIIPVMLLMALYYLRIYLTGDSYVISLMLSLISFLVYCYFVISVHRVVLLHEDYAGVVIPRLSWRVARYLIWFVVVSLILGLIAAPLMILNHLMSNDTAGLDKSLLVYFVIMLPAVYVMARLSLIFPAVALDKRPNIERAWAMTKNNGWRMFIVIGVLPYLFTLLENVISREESTFVEDIVILLLNYVFLIIEISALSFSYQYLVIDRTVREE